MDILVFIKQVLDSAVPLEIREAERIVAQREPEPIYVMSPADRAAVDLAIRLCRQDDSGSVVVATVGPERAESALRLALASGADRAIHVCDPAAAGSDALATAFVLSGLARSIPFDLILCGNGSQDTGTAAVPAMLAELLDLPQVTGAVSLEIANEGGETSSLRAQRRLERGNRQVVMCPLPAIVAVEASAAEPCYVSVRTLMAAERRRVERRTLADFGITSDQVGAIAAGVAVTRLSVPRPRPKKVWTPDSSLSAADRLKLLMGGSTQKKSSSFLEGPADVVAGQLVEYLKKEKLV